LDRFIALRSFEVNADRLVILRNREVLGVTDETSPGADPGLISSVEFFGSKRLLQGNDGFQAGAKSAPRLSTIPFGERVIVEVW